MRSHFLLPGLLRCAVLRVTANRLQTAGDSGGWPRRFGYDTYVNMWVGVASGIGLSPATATSDIYNAATNHKTNEVYDSAGNQTTMGGMYSFSYDAENRQISETNSVGKPAAQYSYDGDGHRVQKTVGGNTTVYVYDALGELAAEYTNTPGGTPPCQTCYLTYDHLGSTRMVTDENAHVVSLHDYLPFGEEIPGNSVGRSSLFGPGSDQVNQKFTGKERDAESGLDYFGARYYGSALGRFTTPDVPLQDQYPENPQSWNLYAYGRNNPLNGTDPTGEWWFTDFLQAATNCFQYGSCHTTAVVAQRIEKSFLDQASISGRSLTPGEKEDLQAQQFGGLTNHQAIRKAQDLLNNTPREDDLVRLIAGSPIMGPGGGPAPKLTSNPKHNPNSVNPEPNNVQDLFDKSVEDSTGVRWAKDSDGTIHRFSRPSNGETHWNGSTVGPKSIRLEDIPIQVRRALK